MPPGSYDAGLLVAVLLLVIPLRNDLMSIPGAMLGAGPTAALDGKGQGHGLRSTARESKVVFTVSEPRACSCGNPTHPI